MSEDEGFETTVGFWANYSKPGLAVLLDDPLLEALRDVIRGPAGPARTYAWRVARRYRMLCREGILKGLV